MSIPATLKPEPWRTVDLLTATGGELISGEPSTAFSGIGIDSRRIQPGEIFVAIKGETHDGHGFVREILDRGGRGVVVERVRADDLIDSQYRHQGVVAITVDDTTRALGQMAAHRRNICESRIVGITGSNGKTSTREMTAAVIRQRHQTLTPQGNFNNEIGLPLTLLQLNPSHRWAVMELGMNHPGEIGRLAAICRPDIGVITNIGPAHLEGVGSVEGVMQAKGELLEHINPGGLAVLNADNPHVRKLAEKYPGNLCLFGLSEDASVRALNRELSPDGVNFTLAFEKGRLDIHLKVHGTFMVMNALAAVAVGLHAGQSLEDIRRGLESFQPVKGRLNLVRLPREIYLIDDTYNANPASMAAALETLSRLCRENRGIAVLGDMFELGEHAGRLHEELGLLAGKSGIARLYSAGEHAETVARGAMAGGLGVADIFTGTKAEIIDDLGRWLQPKDWALVKGSRGMAMEEVVHGLKQRLQEPQAAR
jgi:UDP-N-acetylmuramoyl-tripeptide--D-alanyl-D-alanine ligase